MVNAVLTEQVDIDFHILNMLPDIDLRNISRSCKYLHRLCCDDRLWKLRLCSTLGVEYSKSKLDDMSWCQWYLLHSRHQPDLIGDGLHLDPLQRGIRLLTEQGKVRPGSELYHSMSLNLVDAFKMGDRSSIDYFMSLFHSLPFDRSDPFYGYEEAIIQAYRHGYEMEGQQITTCLLRCQYFIFRDVVREFGLMCRHDLYIQIESNFTQADELEQLEENFIIGLVEGGYIKEGMERLARKELPFDSYFLNQMIKAGLKGNHPEIVQSLRLIAPNHRFERQVALAAIRNGCIDKAGSILAIHEVIEGLSQSNPEMCLQIISNLPNEIMVNSTAIIETADRPLIEYCLDHDIRVYLDYTTISRSTLEYVVKIDPSYLDVKEILNCGRYDLVPILLRHQLDDSLPTLIGGVDVCGLHKDLFLYLYIVGSRMIPNWFLTIQRWSQYREESDLELRRLVDNLDQLNDTSVKDIDPISILRSTIP